LKHSASVVSLDENVIDIGQLLLGVKENLIDIEVLLGKRERLFCRLIAHRVNQSTANLRRRQIRAEAKRKGLTPSKRRLATADWTILVTNTPNHLLSANEALTVMRMRWQIELLFKLWKSINRVDKWRSDKKWRILTEVYGKLLVALLQHWLILSGAWNIASRSFVKAAKTLRRYALMLAMAVAQRDSGQLASILQLLADCLCNCQVDKRNKAPSAFQLLLAHCGTSQVDTPRNTMLSTTFSLS
jgi:Transposase DDE domain